MELIHFKCYTKNEQGVSYKDSPIYDIYINPDHITSIAFVDKRAFITMVNDDASIAESEFEKVMEFVKKRMGFDNEWDRYKGMSGRELSEKKLKDKETSGKKRGV